MEKILLISRLEIFLANGRVLETTGETREEGNLVERRLPTPGNHGVGSVAPGDPTGAQKGMISRAPSFPLQ